MKIFIWVFAALVIVLGGGIIMNTVYKKQTADMMANLLHRDTFHPPDVSKLAHDQHGNSVRRGLKIMNNTSEELPNHVGNTLSCVSCHATGAPNRSLTFIGVAKKYPRMKNGQKQDLRNRINGCMMRSMNGKKLPRNSKDMNAMVDYLTFLSKNTKHADIDPWTQSPELDKGDLPQVSAKKGKQLYKDHCLKCHGPNGNGIKSINTPAVWGKNSYNDSAGMSRNTMATPFIQNAMPKDDPGSLSTREAAAIAKYINAQDRPKGPPRKSRKITSYRGK